MSETDKEYLIKAALPAVKKEDVKVTVDEGVITIKGERKQEKEEKNEKFHRTETVYGSFERSLESGTTFGHVSSSQRGKKQLSVGARMSALP